MFGFIKHALRRNERHSRGYRLGVHRYRMGAGRRFMRDAYEQAENGNTGGICTLCRKNCPLSSPRCPKGEKLRE